MKKIRPRDLLPEWKEYFKPMIERENKAKREKLKRLLIASAKFIAWLAAAIIAVAEVVQLIRN